MAVRRGRKSGLGFDLEAACSALTCWLFNAGVLSRHQVEQCTQSVLGRAEETRTLTPWAIVELARVHGQLHFCRPSELTQEFERVPYCERWPCRPAAVSFALLELGDYRVDLTGGLPAIASDLDALAAHLRKISPELLARLRQWATPINEVLTALPEAFPARKNSEWRRALHLVDTIEEAPSAALAIAEALRGRLSSRQLRSGWSATGGRFGDRLLSAIWQQLDDGGFSAREIAQLVPDTTPGTQSALVERIRKRIGSDDCRSARPWRKASLKPSRRGRKKLER